MAISVIALIRIPPNRTKDDKEKLVRHKRIETALVTLKDCGFSYFERVGERNCFYVFGQFESLDEVYVDLEGIENISDIVQLGGLAHFDCRINSVTADANVLMLHRFIIKADSWLNFVRQLEDRPGETTGDAGRLVCGWRMDPKEDEEEYLVVFAPDDARRNLALSKRFHRLKEFAHAVGNYRICKFVPSTETVKRL
ncbi:hypothetical protein MY10362_003772 [Beauveria mimosiformis]